MQGKVKVIRRVGDRTEVGYTTSTDFDVYLDLSGTARYAYPSQEAAASDGWGPSELSDLDLKVIPRFVASRRRNLI